MREWNASEDEEYAEKWFAENGFNYEVVNRCLNRTNYRVSKDSFETIMELPDDLVNIKEFMELFTRIFYMEKEFYERFKV